MKPKAKFLKYRREDNRYFLVYNPHSGRIHLLDKTYISVINLCNGKNSVTSMSKKLNILVEDIEFLLNELKKRELVG
jgi:aminopeptidase-like protein